MKKYIATILLGFLMITRSVNAIGSLDGFKDIDGINKSTKNISVIAGVDTARSVPEIIGLSIKIVIGLVGTGCLVMIIYGGVLIILAKGEKTKILEARKKMVPAIIGLIILTAAYAIMDFILKQITVVAG